MDGVTAMNGYGYYGPKKVSNVWNVLPDGSLEASLVGPFSLTDPLVSSYKLTFFGYIVDNDAMAGTRSI